MTLTGTFTPPSSSTAERQVSRTTVLEVSEVDAAVVAKKGKAIAKRPSAKSKKDDTKPIISDIMPQKIGF